MSNPQSIAKKLRRFESRGNVAIIFALVGSAAAALMGGTIELNRLANARVNLNAAVDAAALAAKRTQLDASLSGLSISRAAGEAAAKAAFDAVAPGADKGVRDASIEVSWDSDGSARVEANAAMDLVFGGIVGLSYLPIEAKGVATAGGDRKLEVAIVMDTTASMFNTDGNPQTRFTQMRSAAKGFVNTLFDSLNVPNRLYVSVVPWTTTVNIKGEAPSSWSAAPAPVRSPADYGTRALPSTTIDRAVNINQSSATLTTQFAPVAWRGCISGAGETQTANDSQMSGMRWDALRVPPRVNTATRTKNSAFASTCYPTVPCPPAPPSPPPPPPPPPAPPPMTQGYLTPAPKLKDTFAFWRFGNNSSQVACFGSVGFPCVKTQCVTGAPSITGLNCSQDDANGTRNAFFNHFGDAMCVTGGCQSNLNTGLARGCVSDYNEVSYNASSGQWCSWVPKEEWTSFKAITGPNLNCPMPMLGLSQNRTQVIDTIDRLSPSPGGTHADVGLRWGLRSLSPTDHWTTFFGHSRPAPFNGPQSQKIMILMTDGANEQAVNFPGYWGCSQSGAPGCSTSPSRATLDARMLTWCTAIRDTYKVEIYTVAVNVTDKTAVNLLAQCAGAPARAFSVDASQLSTTFDEIARAAMALHLKE